jgi:hypothetical protein
MKQTIGSRTAKTPSSHDSRSRILFSNLTDTAADTDNNTSWVRLGKKS